VASDGYLTMKRIMDAKLEKWKKENYTHNWTGFEQLHSAKAYKDGFMEGFFARFFEQTDKEVE